MTYDDLPEAVALSLTQRLYLAQVKTLWCALTLREQQIVRLACDGYSDRAIAESLDIQPKTVQNHISNIVQKALSATGSATSFRGGLLPRFHCLLFLENNMAYPDSPRPNVLLRCASTKPNG